MKQQKVWKLATKQAVEVYIYITIKYNLYSIIQPKENWAAKKFC